LFPDKYPRGTSTGTVAVLCEGDVNSYEADFLEKWAALTLPNGPDVHVWPCGTGSAVRGMADSIGRTVRIVAMLDRDFHDLSSASEIEKKWKTDADKLGWSFLGLRMWRRNEIENYFLDDDVVLPVMTEAFSCANTDVTQAMDEAVKLLVPFQALQAAFHKTRSAWEDSDPQTKLFQAVDKTLPSHKPTWGANGLQGITAAQLGQDLPARIVKWRNHYGFREPWKGDAFVSLFGELTQRWNEYTSSSPEWREVWAGKEVLKLVRQQLASKKAGWWSTDVPKAQPVVWHAMKNNRERDALDREIEKELRPKLVNRLVTVITSNAADPRRTEFDELATILKG
jgi:hypothetical protein